MNNSNQRPDNNMLWAILTTFFCCVPFGIVSIVYAAKVDGLWRNGEHEEAIQAAEDSKKYAKYGAIIGGIVGILYLIAVAAGALSGY